jgi:uncharacterized protein (DUF488 family)
MTEPVFTIGHSTRPLDEFIELLAGNGIERVVDVRRFAASRNFPQYNAAVLDATLRGQGIDYSHCVDLGGRRKQEPDIDPETNGYWTHRSFHNYADYAMTPPFQAALAWLLETSAMQRCAIMCSEAVWWRCHRRIVTDYLLAHSREVRHILGAGRAAEASMTPAALPRDDGLLVYPPSVQS